ncbi:hypothetical protein ABE527_19015 [Brucella sp. TWI432]
MTNEVATSEGNNAVRTVIDVRNPVWDNQENTQFTADVHFSELTGSGFIPFTAVVNADTAHGLLIWENANAGKYGPIAAYVAPEPQPVVVVIPAVTLWERLTETEAEQVAEVMKTQSVRTVQIFNNATTFRSDHELWPLLEQIAHDLFGAARASELLAP